ncbi:MAG: site-specific integrase [Clostridia bacterium]|nr:site-specific integrase [Clostridia bacterium]
MATAKKLPSGQWRVLLYVGKDDEGKRKYKSFTAPTKKEAEYMAAEYNISEKKPTIPVNMTVGQLIDQYIESKSNILSPTSIQGYRQIRRMRLQPLMDKVATKLLAADVQDAINTDAKRLSPKSIADAYGLFVSALRAQSIRADWRITLPKRQKKFREMPTPETIFQLVHGTDIELPCLLAMWLGLRMSEVRGIKHGDIRNEILTIHSTIVDVDGVAIEKDATKTYDSTRRLRVPQYILNLIAPGPADDHVVQLSGQAIYKRFIRLQEAAEMEPIRFHDLRHLNASVMVALNIPDRYAMERGGWSTNKTLQSVYQHTFSIERQRVDDIVDNYFSAIVQNEMQHEMQHKKKKPR